MTTHQREELNITTSTETVAPGEVGITIKYGKGYEETWATFRGNTEQIRESLITYFGLDTASVTELTTSDLVVNCTKLAHGVGNALAVLGGNTRVIGKTEAATPQADEAQQPSPQAAPPEPTAPEPSPILAQIEAVADVAALQLLWAENQAAFADADVMNAWKAKGKSLQAAA